MLLPGCEDEAEDFEPLPIEAPEPEVPEVEPEVFF